MTLILESLTPQAYAMAQVAQRVASCAAFQQAAGVTSEDEAAEFVHREVYYVPDQQVRKPFAVLWCPAGGGVQMRRLSDQTTLPSGTLILQLGMSIENIDDMESSGNDFANMHGQVADWLSQTPNAGYVLTLTQTIGPAFTSEQERDALGAIVPFWSVEYQVAWDPFG